MLPIEFRSVKLKRGPFQLDLSLKLPGGKLSVILGPSGCGKTTLLDLCAGFIQPDTGCLYQGQTDITSLVPERRNIGVVFQDHALFPHLSALGNAAFGPRMRGKSPAEARRIGLEKLELVGLADLAERKPGSLSGGERQRVSLARAMATDPDILLLDEPMSSLDASLRKKLGRELVRIIDSSNVTALLVTHDQEEALSLADYLAVMNKGQIVRAGEPREVWSDPRDQFTASFLGRRTWLKIQDVERLSDGIQRVKTAAGPVNLPEGHADIILPAALMIRSESLQIHPKGSLSGTISRMEYVGSGWQLELSVPNGVAGDIIAADWRGSGKPPLLGEVLNLRVNPTDLRVIV